MPLEPITIKSRVLRPHKAVHSAQFETRTVLTNDPFNYVDLWLRHAKQPDALFYWRQARALYHASSNLQIQASPLVLYYCFMNATKALLSAKAVRFDERHGVAAHRMRGPGSKIVLSNEGIKLQRRGIAPALSAYLGDTETATVHSLEAVLYNIVCIHRTYCLSYPRKQEIFLPLRSVEFVRDPDNGEVRLEALAASDVDWQRFRRTLPTKFQSRSDGEKGVLSTDCVRWAANTNPTDAEMTALRSLHERLRANLHYIIGTQTLWYLKTDGAQRIARQQMTLIFTAMHRMSEICRYRPSDLGSLLNGQKNWLLSEFVSMAPVQYLDEIACEITGQQIMIPNVRIPG